MAFCGLFCGKQAAEAVTSVTIALSATVTLDDTSPKGAVTSTEEEVAVTRVPHLTRVVQREVVLASRASNCEVLSARVAPAPSPDLCSTGLTVEFRIRCSFDPGVPSGIATLEAATAWSRLLGDSVGATVTAEGIQEAIVRDVPKVRHALVHLREFTSEDSVRQRSRSARHSTLALRTSTNGDDSTSQRREGSDGVRSRTGEP